MIGIARVLVGFGLLAGLIWLGAQVARLARSPRRSALHDVARRTHRGVGLAAIVLLVALVAGIVVRLL